MSNSTKNNTITKITTAFKQAFRSITSKRSAIHCTSDDTIQEPMTVFLSFPRVQTLQVKAQTSEDLYDVVRYFALLNTPSDKFFSPEVIAGLFHITFKGKPLSRHAIQLRDYNIHHGDMLKIEYSGLMGGAPLPELRNILLPTYSHVSDCEKQLLNKLSLQSSETEDEGSNARNIGWKLFDQALGQKLREMGIDNLDVTYVQKLMEDLSFFTIDLIAAKEFADYQKAVIYFIKFRTGKPFYCLETVEMFLKYFRELFGSEYETQSFEGLFDAVKAGLNQFEELKKSPIYKKLFQLVMFATSFSIFDSLGAKFGMDAFFKMEREAYKAKLHMGPSFIASILSTIIFICEKGYQCLKTGSLDPIYHSGNQYERWFDKAQQLKRQEKLLMCPEAHGFSLFEFLADLNSTIEQGESIVKHAIRIGAMERKLVSKELNDLKMIKSEQTTKREAQKERTAPFSVCLYGGSSIGKTTITDMLFFQYGKVFDLPIESEFKYTRNPNAKFWDGFNTSQWFVIMDDIAYMNPTIAAAGDPSVMENIQVCNRVAFVPDQASLDDKGRTPFKARCVVATTNCEDLNAIHYFQTPLAMQRRFPFTIDVTVKPEFIKDECMLDSSKIQRVDGEWPDYWIFTVRRPVPDGTERRKQRARMEEVAVYTDVDDFLAWFSKEAINHERVQKIVETGSNDMKQIEICKKCYRNTKKCVCTHLQGKSSIKDALTYFGLHTALNASQYKLMHETLAFTARQPLIVRSLENALLDNPEAFRDDEDKRLANEAHERGCMFTEDIDAKISLKERFRQLGERVQKDIGMPKLLVMTIAACGIAIGLYKTYNMFTNFMNPQYINGVSEERGSAPKPTNDEKTNVWKHDEPFEMSAFDTSARAMCMAGYPKETFVHSIRNNVVAMETSRVKADGFEYKTHFRAVCLGGHVYVTNTHNIPDTDCTLRVIASEDVEGINGNAIMKLSLTQIQRFDNDVCAFEVLCLPPRKDIRDLFVSKANTGSWRGYMLQRTQQGKLEDIRVDAYRRHKEISLSPEVTLDDHWRAVPIRPTIVGECGALHIAETPLGPQILGIHVAGNSKTCITTTLHAEFVNKIIDTFDHPIMGPNPPVLCGESVERTIGELNERSPMRWIPEGTAAIYGSYEGWRATRKSDVKSTILLEAVLEEGYELKHGKPVMQGKVPWHIAANDMLHPVTGLDLQVLDECKNMFINDIFTGLPEGSLDEVRVYDNDTAINGAIGVAFVDKMKRNTSMGAPYNKSKRHFLVETEEDPDRVIFTPEIMARVDDIIEKYESGGRYMPVFTGTLKDEALPFKKIKAKKTRVFTAAPADWSLVVRKYLLSIIRLIQSNKFVFETAVGTNATSPQWDEIKEYLTQHGSDRMIAGDYGRFDKTMPPAIILGAFDILRMICKKAGYTETELRVVQGIAEDTAFPLVDFSGDLIEFYGSNPSGHPLTVIINSLANALYMRYCYTKLSPAQSCEHFKRDVSLITYGDDNVMGVSTSAPFFHHTNIRDTLSAVGITYTMADKEAESVPYIHIDEISFLKRTWRFDADIGHHMAPLEEDSIVKSLTMNSVSKSLSSEDHAVACLANAHREYFHHGKDVFVEKSAMIQRIIAKCGLAPYIRDNTFPSWETLKGHFTSRN